MMGGHIKMGRQEVGRFLEQYQGPNLRLVALALANNYPMFRKTLRMRFEEFGMMWSQRFEHELQVYFGEDGSAIGRAIDGYCRFSLEAMRLQATFNETLKYTAESHKDAVEETYSNDGYMVGTYLPALLLSHFLWPHHFRQLNWAPEHFFSRLRNVEAQTFYDIGIGTGFYSKEALIALPEIRGWGFDISAASIEHTSQLLARWDVADRYEILAHEVRPILDGGVDAFISVELLEHLDDPLSFLMALRESVGPNALGLISAAIDAPNRDHVYLYRDMDGISQQLATAGFQVLDSELFSAYEKSNADETVPQSGCFVVCSAR